VRWAPSFLAVAALASGCALDPDYGATHFRCEATADCPGGFTCDGKECRPGGGDGAPSAAFTSEASFLLVSLDASSSAGDIDSYAWTFGDDTTGTGVTISHTYDAAGTYQVTLTVTDQDGDVDSISNQVTVTMPPAPLARDTFERTVDLGWGTAAIGGAWSLSGTSDLWEVADGAGRVDVAAGVGPAANLDQVIADSVDVTLAFSVDEISTGSGLYAGILGRRVAGIGSYSLTPVLKPDQSVTITLAVHVGDTDTTLESMSVPGLAYQAGSVIRARLQVFGANPTTLRGRLWADGEEEPGEWQLTTEDSTAELQADGNIGVNPYLSSGATNGPIQVAIHELLAVPVE
jgi:PKD repeat protein